MLWFFLKSQFCFHDTRVFVFGEFQMILLFIFCDYSWIAVCWVPASFKMQSLTMPASLKMMASLKMPASLLMQSLKMLALLEKAATQHASLVLNCKQYFPLIIALNSTEPQQLNCICISTALNVENIVCVTAIVDGIIFFGLKWKKCFP